jgi:protein MAK16
MQGRIFSFRRRSQHHTSRYVGLPNEPVTCFLIRRMAASDEVVWQIINQGFCSFKVKYVARQSSHTKHPYLAEVVEARQGSNFRADMPTPGPRRERTSAETSTMCKHSHEPAGEPISDACCRTGLCNRQSCPLANSRYATVRAGPKAIYLYIKVAERSHLPSKLWEKIRLSGNYTKALAEIDARLQYFPKFLQVCSPHGRFGGSNMFSCAGRAC